MHKRLAALLVMAASAAPRLALAEADATPPAIAVAADDPSVATPALFARAEAEDARGDFGAAVADYRAAVAKLPSFRYAAKAITRAALLESHAEGGWAPYRELESVRRDPATASDPTAIDALAASADAFPPGPTRSEARMLCAEAYVARLHRRADGEATLRKVIDDPVAEPLLRREAATELVTALLDDGDLAVARDTALALGPRLDARMAQRVAGLVRRRALHLVSIADLGLFALLVSVAVGRSAARGALGDVKLALRKVIPVSLVFAAYAAIAGGVLASSYETGNAQPFLAFGLALVPIAVAARAWGAAGSPAAPARAVRAIVSASAIIAAAFLMLEAVNKVYLEGFKL